MSPARSAKLRGDRVQNARPGELVDVWIYSAFPKDRWNARKPGDFTHAEHPGTAIQMGDDLYEILRVEESAEPGLPVRYGLKKWERRHAVRRVIPFTPETWAQAAADYLEEEHKQALRTGILWLFPLAGLAPDPLQREWEKKTALNMALVSAASAVATIFLFVGLVHTFGRFAENKALLYFIEYVGLESFLRLLWIVATGKPHGTLALTVPYLLWEAVARPEKRAQRREKSERFSYEGDEVIRRPGGGWLQIRSMLFDDLLAGPHPIRFEGEVYKPQRWHQEGAGLGRRIVYDLERIDADPKSKYREYTQPRSPERQSVAEKLTRNRDRTQILAFFWGTYPRLQQLRLEARYGFPAAKWTAATAGLLLAGAVLQMWITVSLHAGIHLFAAPAYFILESLYRLYRSKAQLEPAGSLAGYVLGLFLHAPE